MNGLPKVVVKAADRVLCFAYQKVSHFIVAVSASYVELWWWWLGMVVGERRCGEGKGGMSRDDKGRRNGGWVVEVGVVMAENF